MQFYCWVLRLIWRGSLRHSAIKYNMYCSYDPKLSVHVNGLHSSLTILNAYSFTYFKISKWRYLFWRYIVDLSAHISHAAALLYFVFMLHAPRAIAISSFSLCKVSQKSFFTLLHYSHIRFIIIIIIRRSSATAKKQGVSCALSCSPVIIHKTWVTENYARYWFD